MTFSTPVTPTRERLSWTVGSWAWTSIVGSAELCSVAIADSKGRQPVLSGRGWCRWTNLRIVVSLAVSSGEMREGVRPFRGSRIESGGSSGAVSDKGMVLLNDEAPIVELDELRPLIAEGHERGYLTFAQIEQCL